MQQAYDLLLGLALLREANQGQLNDWQGILAGVDQYNILIDRPAVDEMLTVTEATRILDERKWLVGLMNYGGNLLPLVELKMLFDPKLPAGKLEDRQVIILTEKYGPVGLLVDNVKGMRHFWSDDEEIALTHSSLENFMKMQIIVDGQDIHVLSLKKLMSAINFNIVID